MRTSRSALALLFCLATAGPAPAQAFVASCRPLDDLLDAARILNESPDKGPLLAGIASAYAKAVREKLGRFLDLKRPLFAYSQLHVLEKDDNDFCVLVPVPTPEAFLQGARQDLGFQVTGPEKGLFEARKDGETLFLRFAHRYAYVSPHRATLQGALPEPEKLARQVPADKVLTARLWADRIPAGGRKMIAEGFREGVREDNARQPGESDARHAQRLADNKKIEAVFTALANDVAVVHLTFDLDRKSGELTLELAAVPRAGSLLAGWFREFGEQRSLFAAITRQSQIGMHACVPVPEFLLSALDLDSFTRLEQFVEPREALLMRRVARALLPALKAATQDVAFGIFPGPADPREPPIVVAARTAGARQIEHTIRDVIKDTPPAEREGVHLKLNVARHDKVPIHAVTLPSFDKDWNAYFAVRGEALLLGANLDRLRRTLDDLQRPPPAAAPVQFECRGDVVTFPAVVLYAVQRRPKDFGRILNALPQGDGAKIAAIAGKMIPEILKDPRVTAMQRMAGERHLDRRRLRLSLHGGAELRLRLEMHGDLLLVLGPFLP
jgi:hypothetical protein